MDIEVTAISVNQGGHKFILRLAKKIRRAEMEI